MIDMSALKLSSQLVCLIHLKTYVTLRASCYNINIMLRDSCILTATDILTNKLRKL